jgi:hypothetical protein
MTTTRSTLGILVVRMRLAKHTPSQQSFPSKSLTPQVGNPVVLTCIMSTIPHEHVHRVFTSMCITPTFKIIAPQCNESSAPQILKLSRSVSKIVLKFPTKLPSVQRNYGTLLLAFPFLHRNLVGWSLSIRSLVANIDDLVASLSFQLSGRSTNRSFLEQSRFSKSQCWRVIPHLSVRDPCLYPPNP